MLTAGVSNQRSASKVGQHSRHPVILIPGVKRSRLEAQVNGKQEWDTIYLIKPPVSKSFEEHFKLIYNPNSRHTRNPEGVKIRPFKFGDTVGVEYTDEAKQFVSMEPVVRALAAQNYSINENLRGAPYDFRKCYYDNLDFPVDFKRLIEETFYMNGNKPVYLVSKSMGGLYTLYFLSRQSQAWKDKYIKGFVPIAAPWAGSSFILTGIAQGDNFDLHSVKAEDFRELVRTFSSTFGMLPSPETFTKESLVSLSGKNYTAKDNDAILDLYGIQYAKNMYKDCRALSDELPHPMVDVYCIHGSGHDTIEGLIYASEEQFPGHPSFNYGPGDGTVNLVSLEACQRWSSVTKYKFNYAVVEGATHGTVLSDNRTLDLLNRILASH
ncbi:Phospholipase A2 group XV [Halotydeus destructor]|nr:Phospholipase A2 group XV [Halotydeus destructor]